MEKSQSQSQSKTVMLVVLIVMFFINHSFAAFRSMDTISCLTMNGLILKSQKEERGSYKVELLNENTVIDSNFVSVNKPFEFNLAKNSLYTVRISKEGFNPLLINVDTKVPSKNFRHYEFLFQTELRPVATPGVIDNVALNALVGTVVFDEENNRFYPNKTKDPSANLACLKVNGLILKSPKESKGDYKVELLRDNTIIETKDVSYNKPFEFALTKNAWYTIRVTKEGFVPLLISVDTELNKESTTPYEFSFETELYHNSSINSIDKDSFDLPIGLVRFDASKNRFYPIDDYRAHVAGSF